MSNRPKSFLPTLRAAIVGAVLASAAFVLPGKATADVTLPSPYVSRALDAVLLPINNDVKNAFALSADDTGVFVLSVSPGGVAESYGILPGDVISFIEGQPIYEPVDIDTWVYYWISNDYYDFIFDLYRAGEYYSYAGVITYDLYYEVIDIYSIESWSSYYSESFSYSEWYSEYSVEISESYESWETTIEETASSMTEEEMTNAELSREAAEEGVVTEEEMTNDELALEADEEMAAEEEFTDDTAMEDEGVEESYVEPEEESYEEPAEEESYEEPVEESFDDGGGDDGGGDDSGE